MDIRKHLSFINPHSFDSKGNHSSFRDEEKPWLNQSRDSNRNHKSMIHNKSIDENSNELSWNHHSKSLKSLEKDKSPLPQRTRGYQMRRSDVGKENIVNNGPRSVRRTPEKLDATDITNKYKNLFKSYEQLVKLNILNEEALKVEKNRCEEQKRYIGTLTAIIEESITKGGLLAYLKKSFSQNNTTDDIYEYLFDVVDLHKRLQNANELEIKMKNDMEMIKKQASEVLKRKERLNGEVSQFQIINEELKLELQEKQKILEDYKREKDEIYQEKRSLVEYINILKETLAPKGEYQQLKSEVNLYREKLEELKIENNRLEIKNKELNEQKTLRENELEEANGLVESMQKDKEKLIMEIKDKENKLDKKGTENKLKNEDYEIVKAKVGDLKKELEKERETRQKLEVASASRISEIAKLQGQIDVVIKERDENEDFANNLKEEIKKLKEENSYLQKEVRAFEEDNKDNEEGTIELNKNLKVLSEYLFEIEKELKKTIELFNKDTGENEGKNSKRKLNEQNMENSENSFNQIMKMISLIANGISNLNEKQKTIQDQKEKEFEKYKELELNNKELFQRLNVVEEGMLKLNKQNQKLFKEKQIVGSELEQKDKELKEVKLKLDLFEKEKEKETKKNSSISQLIIDYLKCFIFNPEVMDTMEMLMKYHEEMNMIENQHSRNEDSIPTSHSDKTKDQESHIKDKKEALLSKISELERDLYDLQIAEESRYHSLYQLEKQNAHLRDELNEFLSTFGNNEEKIFQSSEKKTPNYESRRERDRPDFSRLFADYRMPMTQINFDTEEI